MTYGRLEFDKIWLPIQS